MAMEGVTSAAREGAMVGGYCMKLWTVSVAWLKGSEIHDRGARMQKVGLQDSHSRHLRIKFHILSDIISSKPRGTSLFRIICWIESWSKSLYGTSHVHIWDYGHA